LHSFPHSIQCRQKGLRRGGKGKGKGIKWIKLNGIIVLGNIHQIKHWILDYAYEEPGGDLAQWIKKSFCKWMKEEDIGLRFKHWENG
jgi:hypothetical protein